MIPNDILEQDLTLFEEIVFLGLATVRTLFGLHHPFVLLQLLLVELHLLAKPLDHTFGIGKPEAIGFQPEDLSSDKQSESKGALPMAFHYEHASELNARQAGTMTLGDLTINRLGFGAMRLSANGIQGSPRDPEAGRAVLRRAVDLGVNHIDTAAFYQSRDGSIRAYT